MNPYMHLEVVDSYKSTIKYAVTWIEDREKKAKEITDATMQFWGSVVDEEQLEQLNTQL